MGTSSTGHWEYAWHARHSIKCFLRTTAVMEACTHIHRRLWKGSGTSCYHRAVSAEPCNREERAAHSLAALQRSHPAPHSR